MSKKCQTYNNQLLLDFLQKNNHEMKERASVVHLDEVRKNKEVLVEKEQEKRIVNKFLDYAKILGW